VPASLRYLLVAVRRDAAPAADVLAALDQAAHRVMLGMVLRGTPGREGDRAEPYCQAWPGREFLRFNVVDPVMRRK